jgi:dTDP-4-dehydrorhamnose reductase
MVGSNVAGWLARRAAAIGLSRDRPPVIPGCQTVSWDPSRQDAVLRVVREVRPEWIIYCGPFSRGSWDLPDTVPPVNQEIALCKAFLDASRRRDAQLTVVSTDAVFAGPRLFHDERSQGAGPHAFGRAAMEVECALEGSGALVVRTHAYGPSPRDGEPCFAEKAWLALAEGLPCELDPHCHATPILATDLAGLLRLAYQRRIEGVCHIAGAERTNPPRFAAELASLAGLTWPGRTAKAEVPTLSASDGAGETSLDTRLARRELNRPMPMLREGLARFVDQIRARAACRHSAQPAVGMEDGMAIPMLTRRFAS